MDAKSKSKEHIVEGHLYLDKYVFGIFILYTKYENMRHCMNIHEQYMNIICNLYESYMNKI